MRESRHYAFTDVGLARRVIAERGWGLLVSVPDADAGGGPGDDRPGGLLAPVASHVPVLVDADADGLVVLGHLGRPDDAAHAPRDGWQALLVVEGPSGYVSPGWYGAGPAVPTWNYVSVHIWGVVEMLDPAATWDVLSATVARFEHPMPSPHLVDDPAAPAVEEYARRIAHGAVAFRLRAQRWQGKAKLSQDKSPEVAERVMDALATGEHTASSGERVAHPYGDPGLAAMMRAVHVRAVEEGER